MSKLTVKRPYEPLTPGVEYKMLSEGYDYYTISYQGKSLRIPKWVFEGRLDWKYVESEEEDDYDFGDWK